MKPYGTKGSKKEEVRDMFDRIAPAYDRLNHLLSFNLDRGWRRKTVRMIAKTGPVQVLDMATGTGDLAIDIARKVPSAHITGIDLSPEMIKLAEQKVSEKGLCDRITLAVGDGEALAVEDNRFDCVAIGFGIRNYQDIGAGLREFERVLRPGGQLFILEFSKPRGKIFGALYRFYFHRILPLIGGWISRDREAYLYLPGSVDEFPDKELFLKMMRDTGFENCAARSLMMGVAYIYTGLKRKL